MAALKLRVPLLLLAMALVHGACSKDPSVLKRESVRRGDDYLAQKKYGEAVVEYRKAIQADGKYGEARFKLAKVYEVSGMPADAYREFILAADLLPDDQAVQLKAADVLLAAQRFEDAKTRVNKVLAASPNNVEAQILRANALAGLNKLDDAITDMQQAIRMAPERSASYSILGAMQFYRGLNQEAEAAFVKAVETDPKSIAARLALANYYWTTGRANDAESAMTAGLALDPKNVSVNRALAYFYVATRRPADAEAHLKVIAEVVPDASGKFMLADFYLSTQRLDDARRLLEDLAKQDKNSFGPATLRLASLGMIAGDTAAATRLVDSVLTKEPSNSEALIAKAQLLANAGKLDEAVAKARQGTEAAPQAAGPQFALGKLHVLRRDETNATNAFNRALELNPRFAPAEVELAKLNLAAGRLDNAERFARSAITKVASYADAHLLLARIAILKGNPSSAEPSLAALVKAFPDSPAVQTEVGLLQLSKNDRKAARATFERVLAQNETYVDALNGLTLMDLQDKRPEAVGSRLRAALLKSPSDIRLIMLAAARYEALGDSASTEDMLKKAITVDPNEYNAYAMLGRIYATHRRLDEARQQFEALAGRQPNSVAAHTFVGMVLELQNRTNEARARYERALQIDPQAGVAANNLAWIYAEHGGNLDVALQLAQKAKGRLPEQPEVNDTLAWIYIKKQLGSIAIAPLLQSIQKDPKNPIYHYHLGLAYVASKNTAKARASLEQALKLSSTFDGSDDARKALAGLKG